MSATIGISDEKGWLVQTWTFRQLIEDVRAQYPTDEELGSFLDDVSILQFIEFHWDDPASAQVARRFYLTARGISDGSLKSSLEGDDSFSEYKKSIALLVSLFDGAACWKRGPTE
jgi:hypothetical protein